ncbi:MAG: hypothetical protein ABIN89_20305 [Chitinophagaceae bacterium]
MLIVFATNTLVGFACSMGLDMGFNSRHHSNEKAPEPVIHVRDNDKKHIHQEKNSANSKDKSHQHNKIIPETFVHEHANDKKHIHKEKTGNHKSDELVQKDEAGNDKKVKDENDNCCKVKVIQFEQLDKLVIYPVSIMHPVFFTVFVSTFYNIDVFFLSQGSPNIKYFVRSHHPPIPDIRIAIQSFQI